MLSRIMPATLLFVAAAAVAAVALLIVRAHLRRKRAARIMRQVA